MDEVRLPPGRGERMAARVDRTLASAGVGDEVRGRVARAHQAAMALRDRAMAGGVLADDHDARYLHPGRTLLVYLEFAAGADPAVPPADMAQLLPVAPLLDSRWPELVGAGGDDADGPAREAATALNRILARAPDPDRWLEGVLGEGEATSCLALAEAFDHVRHLHLEPAGPARTAWVELARDALVPLAHRLGGLPARRLDWWWVRVGPTLI
ncbi:MAG: hypothetical protein EA352_12295 [Gemmatimonadales bacterium]|nr:MAG: hypothetical protein EA352_12295 [Gemmatimonadales bacterium]